MCSAILQTEFTPISDVRGTRNIAGLITSLLEKFYLICRTGVALSPSENGIRKSETGDACPTKCPPRKRAPARYRRGDLRGRPDRRKNFLEVWRLLAARAGENFETRCFRAPDARIHAVLLAEDIPGRNDSCVKPDEFCWRTRGFISRPAHPLVVAIHRQPARGWENVVVEYEPLAPILTLRDAIAKESFHNEPNFIRRGDAPKELSAAPLMLAGEFEFGGRNIFISNAGGARRARRGCSVFVVSSTSIGGGAADRRARFASARESIVVEMPRMGGVLGARKRRRPRPPRSRAGDASHRRPVRVRFNRDQDMALTGHRIRFWRSSKWASTKRFAARAQVHLTSNGGWSQICRKR